MVELLPELQSGLVLEHVAAADFEVVVDGKSFACGNGKSVQQVRDKDGHDFVLKRFALSSEQASRHFFRQARVVHEIDSPNVISFHGAFVDTNFAYLLMSWFSKGDLAEWLSEHQDGSTKSVETCKQIARGICAGLRAIHAQGHVHCDVKPSNVFLTPNLHAVIGDFDGLREIEQSMTRGMHVTFEYLPPEVRDGSVEKVDASIDMFALGVIMEQLFAGLECDATALIGRLKAIDPQDRPSSTQVLDDPFLAAPEVVLHECLVCCAHHTASQVVTCEANHSLCDDCFRESVGSFARGDTETQLQVAENGAVKCLFPTCPEMIPAQEAALHADSETWETVMNGVKDHVEQGLSVEFQRRLDEALESRREDLQVEQHRNTVIESILNLQCPRCGTVFLDFNGCCALSCSSASCSCEFCAWCLRDCGDSSDDCHRHVANCPENTHKHIDSVFGDMTKVLEAMQRRRADKLKAYWAEKLANQSLAVQQGVAAAIGPLLEGLVPQDFELSPATDATEDNDVSADATPSWQDELDVLRSWSGAIPRDPVEEMKKSDWHEAFRSDHARLQKLEELLQQLQDRVRESPKNVDLQAQRNDCKKDLLAKLREVLRGPSVRACEREKSTCNTWLAKFGDGLDDDGKAVPFTEVQQSIQRGEDAFQQWQTRETPATTAARSKQARDELDAKVRKSLGRGGDDGLSFVDPKLLADVEEELNSLHRALQEEIDFAASFDPDEGTPGPCIATATRLARSFVRRSWADALRELNDNLDWMREKLSRFSSCEASPDASSCRVLVDEMLDVEDSISDAERDASRLQRRKLRTDVDVAAINTEITEMEALLKNLRTRRGRLSRQLCTTRARALRAAETHYPELLHDDTWLGQLGVHGAMVELLPELQSGLVLEHVTAADFEVVANGKSFACGNGKFVQQVRDKDGHDFVLKRFALSSEQASRHFLRQARLVHEIDSPNVISFH
ncbi:Serine/threonine-protein kinase RUNKEL (Protein EMBRYO DEFECTIVE 3013) (Protein RUNKEL), partial [Durusdinium trenchii]